MPSERRAYAAMTHHMHTIPIPKDQHTLPTRGRHSALRASLAPRETGPPGSFRLGWVARPTVGIGWNSEGEESKCTDSWWARLQASQALPPARSSFRLSFRSRPAARAAPPRGPPRSADAPHPPGPARALLPAPRSAQQQAQDDEGLTRSALQQAQDEGLELALSGCNASGYVGVDYHCEQRGARPNPYRASLNHKHLGSFRTGAEAALCAARERARLGIATRHLGTAPRVAEPEHGLGSGRRVGAKVCAHPWLSPHP